MNSKPLFMVVAFVAIFSLEGAFPHFTGRTARLRHAVPHIVTAVVNGLLTRFFLAGLTVAALAWAEARSLGLMQLFGVNGVMREILVVALFDLWMFFWHRANHRVAFFWRFHKAHHSDIDMDASTALRFHPGELILSALIRLPILILIGMNGAELIFFETMLNVSTLFHHSNLAVPEKWDRALRMLIVTPQMHRIHHSLERSELNSNFTSLFSVWDRLIGTFRTRQDTHTLTLGLEDYREDRFQRLGGFFITPFLSRASSA